MTNTPTPWRYKEGRECFQICKENGMPIGMMDYLYDERNISREEAKANAAHIVHCVNVHDQLVEALERCMDALGPDRVRQDRKDAIAHGLKALALAKPKGA